MIHISKSCVKQFAKSSILFALLVLYIFMHFHVLYVCIHDYSCNSTHLPLMLHIDLSVNRVSFGSDNSSSPILCQAII